MMVVVVDGQVLYFEEILKSQHKKMKKTKGILFCRYLELQLYRLLLFLFVHENTY